MSPETIELVTPVDRGWDAVIRLVLGGIADRLDLGFDELDDLQLALERLLADAPADGTVRLAFELTDAGVRAHIGPLRESILAEALQSPEPQPGELNLRRILDTVVDSFGVDEVDGGGIVVRIEKLVRGRST